MIETWLQQHPAAQILALIVALVILFEGAMTAFAFLRGRKDNIEDLTNRDKKAMDELHKRVEELKK